MSDAVYLAWRYLAHHRVKTAVLVLAVALLAFVPAALRFLVADSAERLTARARGTPLLVGAKGSPLELTLNSLYFRADRPDPIPYAQARRIQDSGYALAVPLYVRFRARAHPIVGTSLDYFDRRGLEIAAGAQMTTLGECVVGARVAAAERLAPGGHVISSPESVFDLAGVYPLRMRVAAVLAPSGTADDDAVFVDLKTAWVIEGLGHGHRDLAEPEAAGDVLRRDGREITANAAVVEYDEITPDNVESFHFHGDVGTFPITAVLAFPHDGRAATLLRGRYEGADEPCQILVPAAIIDELLGTVFTVQGYVTAALAVVGGGTVATLVLVFLLSLRLRKREIETLVKIGGARARIVTVLGLEIASVLAAGLLLAGALTWASVTFGAELVRSMLTS